MNILKALSKQLFGAKYEGAMKSFVTCLIMFTAVRTAEIRMEIAPSVLFLTASALSAGIMWEVLHSSGNAPVHIFSAGDLGFCLDSACKPVALVFASVDSRRICVLSSDICKTSDQTHQKNRRHTFISAALSDNE